MEPIDLNLTGPEFTRLSNNFYNSQNLDSDITRINLDANLFNYILTHSKDTKAKKKVAFVWIVLNPPYWEFAKAMIEGAKNFFLPGHEVDYLLWSDMPATKKEVMAKTFGFLQSNGIGSVLSSTVNGSTVSFPTPTVEAVNKLGEDIESIHKMSNVKVFPLEPIEWPMPTLLRYHTFLQQEELLQTYDYIFYCDVDMKFVNIVGDEILGEGLTASVNPMYYLDKSMYPPYEPNPESTSYIARPGRIIDDPTSTSGKRFQPLYYAGGFQGGKTKDFITAMKACKKMIDRDMTMLNYIPIWNDESPWNKYLFKNPPAVVLNPSYIYPDSLHNEYYIPRWGRNYQPKLMTLTKKFSLRPLSSQEQEQLTMMKPK